jgi:transmembrane sensor
MADLERKIAEARAQVEHSWSDERVDRVAGALEGRRRRRLARRTALATLALVVAVAAGWRLWAPSPALQLGPGATARLVDGGELRTLAVADGNITVELSRGGARLDVAAIDQRTVRVRAGDVTIEIFASRFLVAHAGAELRVAVESGEVKVLLNGETRALAAGQAASFALQAPPAPKSTVPAPPSEPAPIVTPVNTPSKPIAAPRVQRSWRTSAEQGDFDKAYEQLSHSGPHAVRDVPAELLLAADVARLSHHPAEAVAPLERVVRDHARDPRAPLAAFTLGRVLLDELGRPQQAAAAFAKSRALASDGPLAPDALAREVEAWSRAGDAPRARQHAEEYLQRYPKGARINSVRRFGGIE